MPFPRYIQIDHEFPRRLDTLPDTYLHNTLPTAPFGSILFPWLSFRMFVSQVARGGVDGSVEFEMRTWEMEGGTSLCCPEASIA